MSKRIQGIIVGLILGIIIASTVVFAANTITWHGVLAEGISIVIDGQKINPKDGNGDKVEPIIYNGTTYLPVRAVATALGKAVYWDGPTYTVYLGDMDGKLEYPTAELRDLTSEELMSKLNDFKSELFSLRFQLATGQLENTARIKFVKKDIARVKTILAERKLNETRA